MADQSASADVTGDGGAVAKMAAPDAVDGPPSPAEGRPQPVGEAAGQEQAGSADSEDGAEPAAGEGELPACKLKRTYYCKSCNYTTSNPREYLYHQKDVHKAKMQINKCPYCIYASKCKIKLNRHIQMVHTQPSGVKSTEPTGKIDRSPTVREEEEVEEMDEDDDRAGVEAKQEKMSAEIAPETPVREARPVRQISPRTSFDAFSEPRGRDLKKKFYRCTRCQYLTHIKSRFTKHVKYHSMPMIKCDLCEFRTPYKWNLDRHMKNHSGNGEFQCNQCSFSAHIKQSLTVHIQNHHLPPQEIISKMKSKCNVGGSDVIDEDPAVQGIDLDEEELLRLEREEGSEDEDVVVVKEAPKPKVKLTARKSVPEGRAGFGDRNDFESDFVSPSDVQRNGKSYVKDLSCSVCSYKTIHEKDLQRHEYSQHGVVRNGQIPPVFSQQRPAAALSTRPPTSSATSAASSEGVVQRKAKPNRPPPSLIPIPAVTGAGEEEVGSEHGSSSDGTEAVDTDVPAASEMAQRAERAAEEFLSAKPTDGGGTKSVLDRLFNQKMAAASGGSAADVPIKSGAADTMPPPPASASISAASRASSTRCQFCRHRCKTTDDLRAHEKTCPSRETTAAPAEDAAAEAEKKVFVWNTGADSEQKNQEQSSTSAMETGEDVSEVKPLHQENQEHDAGLSSPNGSLYSTRSYGPTVDDGEPKLVTRRVFKCPNCTFWATTASRFHVHLVGHMNMKPYECSECGYRSNWRWDITKHIKLKSVKDRSHLRAKLFINDGGSTRDYDKYDMYLEYMEVEEGLQCKPQVSSSTRRRRTTSGSPMAATRLLPPPPRAQLPLRPGLAAPPNVTISTSLYAGVSMYEPALIGSPPLARMPMPPRLTRAPGPPALMRPPMAGPVRGVLLPPARPPARMPLVRPMPTPSLESLKRMDPTLAAMGITDENTAIVMPEPPEDVSGAATPTSAAAGAAAAGPGTMSAPTETPADGKKPTVWRCKKCNFKNVDRDLVKAHYRTHSAPYSCGHCGQASKWKHVLQRHCRMKHDGAIAVVENRADGDVTLPPAPGSDVTISVVSKQGDHEGGGGGASFRCDICSYTCANTDEAISAHMQHHTPQPGATFKCMFCPFYVSNKKALSDHMLLHGVTQQAQLSQQPLRKGAEGPAAFANPTQPPQDQQPVEFVQVGASEPQSPNKPFRCSHCPYSSDQRVQFLQHRQMHVPRGLPFCCPACSFSCGQRSVLVAHARLHGLQPRASTAPAPAPAAAQVQGGGDRVRRTLLKPERSTVAGPTLRDSETKLLEEVPLVWVSRGGKFFKMFKCRQCPHVNLRKSNIQDHEKMHTDRDLAGYAHRCTKCNYVCINAGVLSGHLKVHTYWLGKIHAIVDMKKSDEEQLREILGEDNVSEVEVVADKTLTTQPPALGGGPGVTQPVATPEAGADPQRILYFCQHCPARFFHDNEIKIHSRFHGMNLPFTCQQCSYTARQHPHLLAHLKVHSEEYRERTRSLLAIYTCSPDHPPRGTTPAPAVTPQPPVGGGATAAGRKPQPAGLSRPVSATVAPVVVLPSDGAAADAVVKPWKVKRYTCSQCPARFVKEATLAYHQSLHGSNGPFRCDRCNYAVKTYGNLVQHLNLHNETDQSGGATGGALRSTPESELSRPRPRADDFPMSGVDLLKRKLDYEKEHQMGGSLNGANMPSHKVMRFAPPSMMDPNSPYYAERTGNPDFAYPTVLDKYGREREKRYKCCKCPSAFEKREQYVKHISLHSAQSRYTCTVCDYSVKYYPNFCNHMKRHGMRPPPMEEAAGAAVSGTESRAESPALEETVRPPAKAIYTGAPELTAVERQQIVLQRVREEQDALKDESEPARKVHWCELCPYANTRRDTTENHRWRHRFYGSRGGFGCRFCDYACQQSHLLREHHKLHFRACKYVKVDSFTQLVGLEVFIKEVEEGADKENIETSLEPVDVTDQDLLFRASDLDPADQLPGRRETDPALLVDVSTGELLSEKPDPPPDAKDSAKTEASGKKKEAVDEEEKKDGENGVDDVNDAELKTEEDVEMEAADETVKTDKVEETAEQDVDARREDGANDAEAKAEEAETPEAELTSGECKSENGHDSEGEQGDTEAMDTTAEGDNADVDDAGADEGSDADSDSDTDGVADGENGIADAEDAIADTGEEESADAKADHLADAKADHLADVEADQLADAEADGVDDAEADQLDDAEADGLADGEADQLDDAEADRPADAEEDEVADADEDEVADVILEDDGEAAAAVLALQAAEMQTDESDPLEIPDQADPALIIS